MAGCLSNQHAINLLDWCCDCFWLGSLFSPIRFVESIPHSPIFPWQSSLYSCRWIDGFHQSIDWVYCQQHFCCCRGYFTTRYCNTFSYFDISIHFIWHICFIIEYLYMLKFILVYKKYIKRWMIKNNHAEMPKQNLVLLALCWKGLSTRGSL